MGGGKLGEATSGAGVVAGMNLMEYDAMALGPRELGLGREILSERLEEAEFPVLSANAHLAGSSRPLVEPYTVIEVGPTSVGVIGLTRVPESELDGFDVKDPYQALLPLVPEVARKSPFVVLLTNLAHQDAMLIADRFGEIDLVLAALPERIYMTPLRTATTDVMVLSAELPGIRHSGRYVGRLAAELLPDGAIELVNWEPESMSPEYKDHPEMADLLARFSAPP